MSLCIPEATFEVSETTWTCAISNLPDFDSCPSSPNCISSLDIEDESHYVPPIQISSQFSNSQIDKKIQEALDGVKQHFPAVNFWNKPTVEIIRDNKNKYTVIFRTYYLEFPDIWKIQKVDRQIVFKFQSKYGYYDLGVNKKNSEIFRKEMLEALKKA
ncbi:MAG: hypothetical protein Tsb0015_05180 [Simkaniaceae bacterium]